MSPVKKLATHAPWGLDVPRSRASPLTPHRGAGQRVGAMQRADGENY
jgi:hypothetical protein